MGFSSHTESRLWLVAGLLLPIWNGLPGENMRVRRLATDAGESLLGRVLTPEQAHAFRDAFGLADGPVMSPAEMLVRHGRYVTFQMAEVAIPRDLFADILRRIDRLRPNPSPA